MIIYSYLVNDGRGEYFEWGMKGDKERIESFLHGISTDVKYIGEDEWGEGTRVKGRTYAEGVTCVKCKFKYRLGTIRNSHNSEQETI